MDVNGIIIYESNTSRNFGQFIAFKILSSFLVYLGIRERKYIESIYNSFDNNKKAENIYNQIKEYIESF